MDATASRLLRAGRPKARTLERRITLIAPLAAALVALAWILDTQLVRLFSLTSPSWDLGQTQQLLWSLSTGHGWTSSFEYGHNFVGIHLEPILLLLAAVERFSPSPVVPLVFAAVGLAATAPAAVLMFRSMLGDRPGAAWLALALAIPMPFWAATQQAAAVQFHPENLALALAMLAVWAGMRSRPWVFWPLVILVLSCKEDQTFTAFLIGLVIWRTGPEPMKANGRRVMLLAVAWLIFGVGFLQELVRGAGYSPDVAYYWWMFNPAEKNFFLINLTRPDAWLVLSGLLLSVACFPLLAPRWLLLVIPPLVANLLSSHDAQGRMHEHYVMIVMFPVIVAAAFGASRLLEMQLFRTLPRGASLLAAAVPALVIGAFAGQLPPAFGAESWLYTQPPAADRLAIATQVLPSDAAVYADDGAAVWLADRLDIRVIPDPLPSDRYVVIDRSDWTHRQQAAIARSDEIALLSASGRRLLADDGRFQVWSPVGG
ncbi:MAG: DUF2079 domain-containing protein [Candidatus Dormibacterales bacterium]